MATVDDAIRSQARNIEKATGRSMDEWLALAKGSGKERHTEILAWLKAEHGFSHGNADLVAWMSKHGSALARLDLPVGPIIGICLFVAAILVHVVRPRSLRFAT